MRRFPSLFLDLAPIKNKWVQFSPSDVGGSYIGADSLTSFEDKRDKAAEQGKLIYKRAVEDGVLLFTPQPETEGGKGLRHYSVAVAREKLPAFYTRLTGELHEQYGEDALMKFEQAAFDYFNSQEFANYFDYWTHNVSSETWIDARTGFPVKFTSTSRLVPPDSALKLKDTQFSLVVNLSLDDVNAPADISPPSEFISFDDAAILLSGKPRDVYLYEKQLGNIQTIRYALASYKKYTGAYPDSLGGLVVTIAEARKLNPNPSTGTASTYAHLAEYEKSAKILAIVPSDVFTKKPYAYIKTADDFAITYIVHIPSSPPVAGPAGLLSYDSYADVKVVEGENIATSKTFSTAGDKRGVSYGKTSDARKVADLRQVQNALESYYNKAGRYPTGIKTRSDFSTKLRDANIGVSSIPGDYCYAVDAQGSSYVLSAPLESKSSALSSSYTGTVPTGGGMQCSCVSPNYCVSL